MRRGTMLAAAVAALAVVAGVAAIPLFGGRDDPSRPNIIVIVIDTLRRDHVGAYGCPRDTTPTIDALAQENVLFANAYANANWTKPSVASLLTGLYVSQHGVKFVVTSQTGELPTTQRLPADATTIPEALKSAGYHTFGVVENVHISEKLGFAQGFDTWDGNCFGATGLTNQVLYRLAGVKKPFFLYLHYFDPHAPYYRTRAFESGGQIVPGLQESKSTDLLWSTYTYGVDRGVVGMSPVERERLIELYDGEVRYVDVGIGRILETLKRRGLYDNSWIIVTADHGENFREGGRLTHPHDCFANPQVRIPLVMKLPKALGVRDVAVADHVQLVDIAPTILKYVGVDRPAGMMGADLMPALLEHKPLAPRAILCESESGSMIMTEGYKYVNVPTRAGVFESLYSVAKDPLEEHNVRESRQDAARRLAAAASGLENEAKARLTVRDSGGVALSEAEIEKMRALGYLH